LSSGPQRAAPAAATAPTARDPIDVSNYSLYANHRPTSLFQKGLLAAGSALAAIINPERADMIATLGETTGPSALRALHARMAAHPVGREILQTKPRCVHACVCVCVRACATNGLGHECRITEDTLEFDKLLALPEDTLGGAYARWMRGHEFTPDERYVVLSPQLEPARAKEEM
jgi:ubiquinone biosynthesis protein Coq4